MCASPAVAEDAEADRLEEEIRHLAKKNTWAGLERSFLALMERDSTPTYETWIYGAQAARQLGKILETRERLDQAQSMQPSDDVAAQIKAIDTNFGRVVVLGALVSPNEMKPAVAPFAADQRKAIEVANGQLGEAGFYLGMMPKGKYAFGGNEREVHTGDRWTLLASQTSRTIDSPNAKMAWGGGAVQWQGESLSFAEVKPMVLTNDKARGALGASRVMTAVGATTLAGGATVLTLGLVAAMGEERQDPNCDLPPLPPGAPAPVDDPCELPRNPLALIVGGSLTAVSIPVMIVGFGGKKKAIQRYNEGL